MSMNAGQNMMGGPQGGMPQRGPPPMGGGPGGPQGGVRPMGIPPN